MASVFKDAVAQALAEQPGYLRRKDSLTALAGTALQVGNLLVAFTADAPAWVNILIAAVIGIAQIVVHAGTKGAITPSMVQRLEKAGVESHLDRVSLSSTVAPADPTGLPVYDFPSSSEYVGKRRADED